MKKLSALSVSSSAYSPFPKGEISSDIQHVFLYTVLSITFVFS